MRLFIGLKPQGAVLDELLDNIADLKNESVSGSFTDEENLHITLAFLGEIRREDLPYVKEAMIRAVSDFDEGPLRITLGGFGSFNRRGRGRLYFRETEDNERLNLLQRNLEREIRNQGFYLEKRKFMAHITIARNCTVYDDFDYEWFCDGIFSESCSIGEMILFESQSAGGRQIYTPIYSLKL